MWDINDVNLPESEAVQAEREVWEDIARSAPVHRSQATAEAALAAEAPLHNGTLDERVETAAHDACDNCHFAGGELFYNEATGLSLCERCDTIATTPVDTTVSFKRLRNGAWGITGPAALLVTGQLVAVTKRSGETTTVTVGRVLWSGDGKAIAATRRA